MPELKPSDVSSFLKSLGKEPLPPLFFIWGETFLCRKVFDTLIEYLLPGKDRQIGYELLEGDEATIPALIERLATFSIFQDRRVVAIKEAPIFLPPGSAVPTGFKTEDVESLKIFLEKGIPENHFLVMTASNADRRRNLFSTIKEVGIAIDCTVPKGNRKADQTEKTALLRATMKEILDKTGKGIDGDAFHQLTEMTGFEPATFADNLERLIAFIGERKTITAPDVHSVVQRTRKDALFELNNAVSDRKLDQALFYLNSLGKSGFHPLQLHASLTNHFRKLVMVKNFILAQRSNKNNCWQRGNKNYNGFMKQTMPWVVKADAKLSETLEQWQKELRPDSVDTADQGKKGKKKSGTDLLIAPNPKNGYPVFQLFLKSDLFSLKELHGFYDALCELDYQLKTSSDSDPKVLLEALIIKICLRI